MGGTIIIHCWIPTVDYALFFCHKQYGEKRKRKQPWEFLIMHLASMNTNDSTVSVKIKDLYM